MVEYKGTNQAAAVCFISSRQGIALHALVRGGQMDIEELAAGFTSLVNGMKSE